MREGQYDVVVIGAGIVGLSVAMELGNRFPRVRLGILEKEDSIAQHQSGHNSGVIHSGIYYKPGSLKARNCVAGATAMVEFCKRHGIRYEICGKVIVATNDLECARLIDLVTRGESNGIRGIRRVSQEELSELEPHCGGLQGLHVPSTGITNYAEVCAKYLELVTHKGGELRLGSEVTSIRTTTEGFAVETSLGAVGASYLINCAGLQSDRVARMSAVVPDTEVVPFRGEYYDLIPERQNLVRALIYPVPDPRFPFLGVHFTRRITGEVDAGPNAVLALKREGYKKSDFSWKDTAAAMKFPGFWRMARRYWRSGVSEFYRSFSKRAFVHALQRLVPEVNESDLVPGGSGVRAQAICRDGSLADDFIFQLSNKMLNVCNVPSPAATASIPIGQAIVDMAARSFDLH
jgi:(S)-2-hydroxyglutarate dehydrogenase